ncbi:MAG: porin family protein [Magnetococcales bacterium]|nr:porin family protein [Magnetococcales bacterium]
MNMSYTKNNSIIKTLLFAVVLFVSIPGISSAGEEEKSEEKATTGVYTNLNMGAASIGDYDTGLAYSFVAGYQFSKTMGLETELSYFQNKISTNTLTTTPLMLNIITTFNEDKSFAPFIGVGIGRVSMKATGTTSNSDSGFNFQLGARYETMSIRYQGISVSDASDSIHLFQIGFRRNWF